MAPGVSVVPMTSAHVGGYRACLDAVARERSHLGLVEAPPLDVVRGWVEEGIQQGAPHFVALDGGTVVGWCDVVARTGVGFTHSGRLGMGLLPAYRGKGLGRRLLDAVLAEAWNTGLERIDLEVYASNEAAVALYRKTSFQTEGVKRRARFFEGSYEDVLIMGLLRPE